MPSISQKLRSQDQKQLAKRLQIVKRQLYGSDRSNQYPVVSSQKGSGSKTDSTAASLASAFTGSFTFKRQDTPTEAVKKYVSTLDIDYLKRDLAKILFLSTAAVGTQLGLYLLARNQVLKF